MVGSSSTTRMCIVRLCCSLVEIAAAAPSMMSGTISAASSIFLTKPAFAARHISSKSPCVLTVGRMAEFSGIAYWRPNTLVSPIVDGAAERSAGGASARRTVAFINTGIGAPGYSGPNTAVMTLSSTSEARSRILYSRCAALSSLATRRVPTHTALAAECWTVRQCPPTCCKRRSAILKR